MADEDVQPEQWFGSGGDLETLAKRNPVPEFDDRVEFYEYLVMRGNKKVEHPIDHDTGELGAPLPPDTFVAEHRYFVHGVLQSGSATGKIGDLFDKFNDEDNAERMHYDDRTFDSKNKYYMLGFPEAITAWTEYRTDALRSRALAFLEAVTFAIKLESDEWRTTERLTTPLVRYTVEVALRASERYAELRELPDLTTAILCDTGAGDDALFDKFVKLYRFTLKQCYLVAWRRNGDKQALLGRNMHRSIELCYNGALTKEARFYTPAMRQFYDFHVNWVLPRRLRPFRTELSMCHAPVHDVLGRDAAVAPDGYVCGMIDMLFIDEDGHIWLLDWKRSRELEHKAFKSGDVGRGACEGMPNCNVSKYSMQLCLYQHFLESETDLRVVFRGIACFHPNQSGYQVISVPDYRDRVLQLLRSFVE